jgi:hypothetical protein
MRFGKALSRRSTGEEPSLPLSQYLNEILGSNGMFPFGNAPMTTLGAKQEEIRGNFEGYAYQAMKANPIIFACMETRRSLFSQATFNFRRQSNGRAGQPFSTGALAPLQHPWSGATTNDLLSRMSQDVDLAGNWFGVLRPGGKIKRLRPDWVTMVLGSYRDPDVGFGDVDAEVLGYIYTPGGPGGSGKTMTFLAHEVAHFMPTPDPIAEFRGMSWITPLIREIMGDQAMTTHKLQFFENGAVPGMVVNLGPKVPAESFDEWVDLFEESHTGSINAFKTLYLAAGAEAEVVGSDLKSIEFQAIQGQGETRISSAAGIPPIIAGLSEGLKAATMANYENARRHFGDATARPWWLGACSALETIIEVPTAAQLSYDASEIPYLQQNETDAAEIQFKKSEAVKRYVEAGYTPESAVVAVDTGDMSQLEHSGLVSVQLHPPGSEPGSTEGPAAPASDSSSSN